MSESRLALERLRGFLVENVADEITAPRSDRGRSTLLLVTSTPGARGSRELAAATAVAAAGAGRGVVAVEADPAATRSRSGLLSSWEARALEEALSMPSACGPVLERPAARGRVCFGAMPPGAAPGTVLMALRAAPLVDLVIVCAPPMRWRRLIDREGVDPDAVLVRADLPDDRAQAALLVGEMRARGVPVRIATGGLGPVGARRALAGIDAGGPAGRRALRLARALGCAGDQSGQALPLALGAIAAVVAAALVLVAFGAAVTAKGRMQRAADLAAISAARSMRDDHRRLFSPARDSAGRPNPAHLEKAAYLERATLAAIEIARANGAGAESVRVSFPDRSSLAPVRARVVVALGGGDRQPRVDAEAIAAPAALAPPTPLAAGGGYAGPLARRQGVPMRPDVARGFDRMQAAAASDGLALAINSGFRSDAEQARLFAANPDPRWVAPPGKSLHRCGTELDLGPNGAHPWLAANADRFGFAQRYAWEPWHYGYTRGPAPCSAPPPGGRRFRSREDGRGAGGGLPAFVPARYRAHLARAGARHDVPAPLLAAQLLAESNFNPFAVSPAGARGIAQFMPATAAAYGLRDPLEPGPAIDAQARLMADLLRRFGRTDLALAAYNAGPAAVEACACADPFPETAAYVSRILGLLGGSGGLEIGTSEPLLEVRLVD